MPAPRKATLARRLTSEALGTALLLAAIVGSGIMAESLSGGNTAVALLANTIATGTTLAVLILTFGPLSGAHFNPVVTVVDASQGGLRWGELPAYVTAQLAGAVAGVAAAHRMFDAPLLQMSTHARSGVGQVFSEFVATFGLLTVILGCSRSRPEAVPFAVGLYIIGAFWFTASTSFANPAVTIARGLTDTFAGIRPTDISGFLVAQVLGAVASTVLCRWLLPARSVATPEAAASHTVWTGEST
jgi:glycerol uptake facilitator-like aquaporin